jgi:hypothetical protein
MATTADKVTAVILGISIAIVISCCVFEHLRSIQQKLVPIGIIYAARLTYWACGALGVVMVSKHWDKRPSQPSQNACSFQDSINPDIGGIGVRMGFYILTGLTHLSLILGHFCDREIGTKELGVAQLTSKSSISLSYRKANQDQS